MKRKLLNQFTTEEKVEFFDKLYKKTEEYFEDYEGRFSDEFDDESWEFRENVTEELTNLIFPGSNEKDVFKFLDEDGQIVIEDIEESVKSIISSTYSKEERESMKFVLYSYDWKESMDTSYVSKLQEVVGGKRMISELDPQGDEYEYCIHSHDVGEERLEIIREAIQELSYDDGWMKERCDGEVLTLDGEEDFEVLCNKVKGIHGEEILEEKVRDAEYQDEKYVASEPYENKIGHIWQIINDKGFYFDFVLQEFTASARSTTYLPIYDLAVEMVDRYELEGVRFLQRPIPITN